MISPKDKCFVTFNRFLTDFVRDINKASDVLKKRNKSNKLNVIESCSPKYIETFIENAKKSGAFAAVASSVADGSPEGGLLLKNDALLSLMVLPETTVADIFELLNKKSESTCAVKEYVLLFLIVASLVSTSNEDVIDDVITLVARIQGDEDAADGGDDAVTTAIQGASKLTADVRHLLLELHWTVCVGDDGEDGNAEANSSASGNTNSPFNIDPRMLENTTIGDIAKEVAQELDVSNMEGIRSMEDVFKNTGNGNVIGNIVSKVGSKLQEKIANGNINQQDLIKEAFGMFSPFMSDMLKNMPNNATKRSLSTRERLKKKLSERTTP